MTSSRCSGDAGTIPRGEGVGRSSVLELTTPRRLTHLKPLSPPPRGHGATAVEGHPVDVVALTATRVGGSARYTGMMAMFVAVGFSEVGRTFPIAR